MIITRRDSSLPDTLGFHWPVRLVRGTAPLAPTFSLALSKALIFLTPANRGKTSKLCRDCNTQEDGIFLTSYHASPCSVSQLLPRRPACSAVSPGGNPGTDSGVQETASDAHKHTGPAARLQRAGFNDWSWPGWPAGVLLCAGGALGSFITVILQVVQGDRGTKFRGARMLRGRTAVLSEWGLRGCIPLSVHNVQLLSASAALVSAPPTLDQLRISLQAQEHNAPECATCGGTGLEDCFCRRWSDGDVGCGAPPECCWDLQLSLMQVKPAVCL